MKTYPDEFLGALGAWQHGWREDQSVRLSVTDNLRTALERASALPSEALRAHNICFRKRFLVPNNPQSGGDFWPFFWDGEIKEGVASWTTDYDFAKFIFKNDLRRGTIAAIFRRYPSQDEVVLNISELWKNEEFVNAVNNYASRNGTHSAALLHFKSAQSEVILNAPLTLADVHAFCGQVPSLEEICRVAQNTHVDIGDDEEEVWSRMVKTNLFPTSEYWIEQEAAQRAVARALDVIGERFKSRLKT
jgi:hypothetical protein